MSLSSVNSPGLSGRPSDAELCQKSVGEQPRQVAIMSFLGWRSVHSCVLENWCAGVLCATAGCFLVTAAWCYSPTADEPAHLASGLAMWGYDSFHIYIVNPPLVKLVAALPCCLFDPQLNIPAVVEPGVRPEFGIGAELIRDNAENVRVLFFIARLACLPFFFLLVWVSWKWSRELFGRRSALLAVALCCLSPMLLGHGALMTPDVAGAALGMYALYCLNSSARSFKFAQAGKVGLALGLALAAKFTWAVLLPPFLVLTMIVWLIRNPDRRAAVIGAGLAAGMIAVAVVSVFYGGRDLFVPLGNIPLVSEALRDPALSYRDTRYWSIHTQPDAHIAANRFVGSWLGAVPWPAPALYLRGIDLQWRDFDTDHFQRSYLMGTWRDHGWWYYYLAAYCFKTPLPVLCLLVMAAANAAQIVCQRFRRAASGRSQSDHSLLDQPSRAASRDRSAAIFPSDRSFDIWLLLLSVAAVFVLVSSQTAINAHARYVLPAYGPLVVLISSVATYQCRVQRRIILLLIAMLAVNTSMAAPNWVGYLNSVAEISSPDQPALLGSNVSWGQSLYAVRAWAEAEQISRDSLFVAVASTYEPAWLGIQHHMPEEFKHADFAGRNHALMPPMGYYAVDQSMLFGRHRAVYDGNGKAVHVARYLRALRWFPYRNIGVSGIRVIHVTEDTLRKAIESAWRDGFVPISSGGDVTFDTWRQEIPSAQAVLSDQVQCLPPLEVCSSGGTRFPEEVAVSGVYVSPQTTGQCDPVLCS